MEQVAVLPLLALGKEICIILGIPVPDICLKLGEEKEGVKRDIFPSSYCASL